MTTTKSTFQEAVRGSPVGRCIIKVLLVVSGSQEICLDHTQHSEPLVIRLQLQTHPVTIKGSLYISDDSLLHSGLLCFAAHDVLHSAEPGLPLCS